MADIATQIEALEQKAVTLKRQKKYLEALKKYEEVILLKRDCYGERSETVSHNYERTGSNVLLVVIVNPLCK